MEIENIMHYLLLSKIMKPEADERVKRLICSSINKQQMEFISKVMYDKNYRFLSRDAYFKTPYSVDYGDANMIDQLIDMGLYDDGYVYGQAYNSDDWGDDFNPYYHKMKCNIYLLNENLQLVYVDATISTYKLHRIEKDEIKYFKYVTNKP